MINSSPVCKRIIHTVLLLVFCALVFLSFPQLCGSHSHGHDHDDHHHDHEHGHESPSHKYSQAANEAYQHSEVNNAGNQQRTKSTPKEPPRDTTELWIEAFLSTSIISAAPFFILFLVPLDKSKEKRPLLKTFLSFASGGLLGDAFLHLIPHALTPHSHGEHKHHHDEHGPHDMSVGLWVLSGIVTFLLVEKGVRLIKGGHSHNHSQDNKANNTENVKKDEADSPENVKGRRRQEKSKKEQNKVTKNNENKSDSISVAGYLNLAADFTHNFTDGLAIGASYLVNKNVGIVTTVTILLHEVPHEIGDFAILIQSGCSRRKAMLLQLTTAIGALSGTFISLMAGGIGAAATSWILPFTAGGFIYIATVSVIPELLEDSSFFQSVKEIFAMLVGVYMMVLIADYE